MRICKLNIKLDSEYKVALASKLTNKELVKCLKEGNLRGVYMQISNPNYLNSLTQEQINVNYSRLRPNLRKIRSRYADIREVQNMPMVDVKTIINIPREEDITNLFVSYLKEKEEQENKSLENCLVLTKDFIESLTTSNKRIDMISESQQGFLKELFSHIKESTDFEKETVFATDILTQFGE